MTFLNLCTSECQTDHVLIESDFVGNIVLNRALQFLVCICDLRNKERVGENADAH